MSSMNIGFDEEIVPCVLHSSYKKDPRPLGLLGMLTVAHISNGSRLLAILMIHYQQSQTQNNPRPPHNTPKPSL